MKEFEVVGKPKGAGEPMVIKRLDTHEEAVEHALAVNMNYWEDVWVRKHGEQGEQSKPEPAVAPVTPQQAEPPALAVAAPTIKPAEPPSAMLPTKPVEFEEADFTVVAANPQEMVTAQRSMVLWAARKIQAEKEVLKEEEEQFNIAIQNSWGTGGWARKISLSKAKIEYYRKIKTALEAGYYIVPPFPIDIFAVRTIAKKVTTRTGWLDINLARRQGVAAKPLAAGDGDYVSNLVQTRPHTHYKYNEVTKQSEGTVYHHPSGLRPVEFPFKLAKAAVMSETARAMALKVFDQLGVMGASVAQPQAAAADPIICGQILPWFHNRQPVTFFVAWWLDTKTL